MFSSYAISLELIADALIEHGIRDIRPKVVFSCGNAAQRPRAGPRQPGIRTSPPSTSTSPPSWAQWAGSAPRNRGVLHLNDDMQIVEILNDSDRPVVDGEVGQVVVTQLCCLAQPLMRYRLGDLAARIPASCSCGRGLGGFSARSRGGLVT